MILLISQSVFLDFAAFLRHLNSMYDVCMPPSQEDLCTLTTACLRVSSLCSTLLILNMTLERFYSIIRPHKAASFNTVKRAKITTVCIVIFCVLFNIPHLFITSTDGARCGPFGKAMKTTIGKFYYFISLLTNSGLPFIFLLIMNSFIISAIRQRPNLGQSRSGDRSQVKHQSQGQK